MARRRPWKIVVEPDEAERGPASRSPPTDGSVSASTFDYARASRHATDVARESFDATRVLARLLATIGM